MLVLYFVQRDGKPFFFPVWILLKKRPKAPSFKSLIFSSEKRNSMAKLDIPTDLPLIKRAEDVLFSIVYIVLKALSHSSPVSKALFCLESSLSFSLSLPHSLAGSVLLRILFSSVCVCVLNILIFCPCSYEYDAHWNHLQNKVLFVFWHWDMTERRWREGRRRKQLWLDIKKNKSCWLPQGPCVPSSPALPYHLLCMFEVGYWLICYVGKQGPFSVESAWYFLTYSSCLIYNIPQDSLYMQMHMHAVDLSLVKGFQICAEFCTTKMISRIKCSSYLCK